MTRGYAGGIPPLSSVRAFEAAARLQSFSRAAAELNMTPAAVSYQIKQLEGRLGFVLFRRLPRRVVLTQAGERLAPRVLEAFRTLQLAFGQARERSAAELAITSLPTIASSWMVPRLSQFKAANPHLQVRLDISVGLADLEAGEFDVGIRSGEGSWPGMRAHRLLPNIFTPLLSPALARLANIRTPRDLLRLPLIGRQTWWRDWFDAAGCPGADLERRAGVDYGIEHFDVTAAIEGQGVALVSPIFFAREIAEGRLVQLFDTVGERGGGYWLAYPHVQDRNDKVRTFTAWIKAEADRSWQEYRTRSGAGLVA